MSRASDRAALAAECLAVQREVDEQMRRWDLAMLKVRLEQERKERFWYGVGAAIAAVLIMLENRRRAGE